MAGLILPTQPHFATMRGDESDSSLVLDVGPDGKDRSTSALDMTPVADTVLGGRYATFDGTGDYLLNATANWRSSDSAGTIVAWVRLAATGASCSIFSSCDTATANYYWNCYIHWSTKRLMVETVEAGAAQAVRGDTVFAAGQWYHVVITSNGSAYAVYVDGVAETLDVVGGSDAGQWFADVTLRDNIAVGNRAINVPDFPWNGDIANVRVYSEAKSADWVAADYARGVPDDSLVLAVDGTGTDRSRYGLSFTPQADAIVGGRWMTFDGTGDYLLNSTGNWRSSDSGGAIEAWVRPGAIGAGRCIFSSNDTATANYYVILDLAPGGTIRFYQRNADTADQVQGSTVLVANRWYHVVVASSGTAYSMYINGADEGTLTVLNGSNAGDWFADTTLRDNVAIGAFARNTVGSYWTGDIGLVKVYSSDPGAAFWAARYKATRGRF
jgi:hypothetical protein